MGLAVILKHKVGSLFPARVKEAARLKKGSNLNDGVSIALIFSNSDEAYLNSKRKFLQSLKGDHGVREAVILTYADVYNKEVPVYLSKLKELDFFTKEDLSWRLKPTEVIDNFCKKRFDILIDLTMEKCNPLEHIMASSQAALKVCRKGAQNQNYADLIVDIAVEKSEKEFLVHMKEMLSKFSFN